MNFEPQYYSYCYLSFSPILCLHLQLARASEFWGHFKSREPGRHSPLPPGISCLWYICKTCRPLLLWKRSQNSLVTCYSFPLHWQKMWIKPKPFQAMYSSCKMQGPPSPQEPKVLTHSNLIVKKSILLIFSDGSRHSASWPPSLTVPRIRAWMLAGQIRSELVLVDHPT